MSTLLEIEAATEALSPAQRAELIQFLAARISWPDAPTPKARLVREGDDVLLEAPPGAPPMTTENVKRMLEDSSDRASFIENTPLEAGPTASVRKKVAAIFRELGGERAVMLEATRFPAVITSTITAALAAKGDGSEQHLLHSDEISFHLTDWSAEAAFLVAVHLFPERFTPEEIRVGVDAFLIHVPSHVIAAARLGGYQVEDIFKEVDHE